MSVTRYLPGEHPSGFSGWKVSVSINGKQHQRFFSDQSPSTVKEHVWCEYQELRARIIDLQLMKRHAVQQYLNFIRYDDPRTKPARRVGMKGLTADILNRGGRWSCGFRVGYGAEVPVKFFEVSTELTFTEAWEQAVEHWGQIFGIRQRDCEEKSENPPPVDIFKQLRRLMNDEGHDVPVSVLGPVYAEQRLQIAGKKGNNAPAKKVDVKESDILQWFQRETGSRVA
ncbi:hypothetical protein [Hahella ganghwensis]|uniref:hypothetical protein n=1 Tax=Hahella ganghwensis TaxID=286420 RepID=UPI00036CDB7C|nr:hypothetical protein [Hahella ganghwensis]